MKINPYITRIKAIAHALQPLHQEVVLVSGATIALYKDDPLPLALGQRTM